LERNFVFLEQIGKRQASNATTDDGVLNIHERVELKDKYAKTAWKTPALF
jgi:hypothetical protein